MSSGAQRSRDTRSYFSHSPALLPAGVCFAADQDQCEAGASVSEVEFTLNLRGSQGEIIPLALSF
jgi:hypothetical protein